VDARKPRAGARADVSTRVHAVEDVSAAVIDAKDGRADA
jgi:hypothetical protein